ncbi:MAG TPA: phosphoribosylglycinamide formyltransferase [Chitinophagaceae bacterium]
MFERLQKKWKVSGLRLVLILTTFALGGSLTGYVGRRLMQYLPIELNWLWVAVYIIVITLIWPLAVLLVSIPFGQYRFFVSYLKRMGSRFAGYRKKMETVPASTTITRLPTPDLKRMSAGNRNYHIAIFASGAGTNAQKIIDYFRYSKNITVALILCNKQGAGVIAIAEKENIPVILIDKEKFFRGSGYVDELMEKRIDLVVLAGFLWKIPAKLIEAFPRRIINIHPALLPRHGGKGMYGRFVHEAVLADKEKESGISIHYVDEHYDQGDLIFQESCPVLESDTADSLAMRIHKLEHEQYPKVIEEILKAL